LWMFWMFLGCILVDEEDEWDSNSGQEDEACSCIQSASWSRTHWFLKPRLLRCLGLRPRSIPGDDSSCFAVVLTRMCAWLGRIFHHSASPRAHTATRPHDHTIPNRAISSSCSGLRRCESPQRAEQAVWSRAAGPRPQRPLPPKCERP
jgi:hypothetical protein